jgi:hypothetical protein
MVVLSLSATATATATASAAATATATATASASGNAGWSAPAKVPGVHGLFAVSCPTSAFCMAVGRADAVAYRKGRWTAPTTLGTDSSVNGGLTTVSCTGPTFCMAGSGAGDTYVYDGTGWSPLGVVAATGIADISCAGPTFCGALDSNGSSYFYDGSTWSGAVPIRRATQALWLSCPVSGACVAVDAGADGAVRYQDGGWSGAGQLATSTPAGGSEPDEPSAISCAGTGFCAALDDFGEAFTWRGGRWSPPTRFDAQLLDGSDAVSCVSASFCMAVDDGGLSTAWNGASWSTGFRVDPGGNSLTDVSCATAHWCIAVDARGHALRYG